MSFESELIWLTLTPAASCNSNIVTTGPVSAATTLAEISNSLSSPSATALTTFSCTRQMCARLVEQINRRHRVIVIARRLMAGNFSGYRLQSHRRSAASAASVLLLILIG
jgi:hypothetical protein